MATTYSIDLGIDANATAGAPGTESAPYPLQIGLSEGTLSQDSTGQSTGFEPTALASFDQIRSGDLIIFRIFDITSIGSKGNRSLVDLQPFPIEITNLDGKEQRPWIDSLVANISSPGKQTSLAFVRGSEKCWPCFFQRNDRGGIVTTQVGKVTEPMSFLLTVGIPAVLKSPQGDLATSFFRVDPEMVISPDEEPSIGVPGQSPGIAATSR